jgi:hypothetical protein
VRRQVQAAVGRQAFEQDVGEAAQRLVAAGADVLHRQFFLAEADDRRQHRRQRLHLGERFAFMRPSTVSCVRMMRSVWLFAFRALALQHGVDRDVVRRPGCR